MNLRLWQRLFLTFAALASIALAGFVIWQQQAFRRGFLAYLDQAALERLQPVSERLAEAYEDNGNWDFLRNDMSQFGELILPDRHRALRQSNRAERLRAALPLAADGDADAEHRHPPSAWREHQRERDARRADRKRFFCRAAAGMPRIAVAAIRQLPRSPLCHHARRGAYRQLVAGFTARIEASDRPSPGACAMH